MYLVSVIMPVYNSEKYLENAIVSVLEQSYSNLNLILVDDGSTDSSGNICDEYSRKDKRVTTIHKPNGGICSARNIGLSVATGKFVAFIDNDDLYDVNLLKDNVLLIMKQDADFVKFGAIQQVLGKNNQKVRIVKRVYPQDLILTSQDKQKFYFELKKSLILNTVWNGLYNREFLVTNNIMFDEKIKFGYDDQMFNLRIYKEANSLIINSRTYYNWIQRINHSTSCKIHENKIAENYSLNLIEEDLINCLGLSCLSDDWLYRIFEYLKENLLLVEKSKKNTREKILLIKEIRKKELYKKHLNWHLVQMVIKRREFKSIILISLVFKIDIITKLLLDFYCCFTKRRN